MDGVPAEGNVPDVSGYSCLASLTTSEPTPGGSGLTIWKRQWGARHGFYLHLERAEEGKALRSLYLLMDPFSALTFENCCGWGMQGECFLALLTSLKQQNS